MDKQIKSIQSYFFISTLLSVASMIFQYFTSNYGYYNNKIILYIFTILILLIPIVNFFIILYLFVVKFQKLKNNLRIILLFAINFAGLLILTYIGLTT